MAAGSGLNAGARMGLGAGAAAVAVVAAVYFTGQPQGPEAPVVVTTDVPAAAATEVPAAVSQTAVSQTAASETAAAPVATETAATEVAAPETAAAPAETASAEAAVADATAAPAVPEPEPAAAVPSAEMGVPSFDVVRVEPDGSATVAGKAAPGAVVSLQVAGVEVAQAKADGQGNFVTLFTLPDSDAPRLLSVIATGADGTELAGTQQLAVAPTAAPGAVATAEPAPAAAPSAPVEAVAPAVVAEAPAAILVSPEGVKVVQPAATVPAEVAANVAVDSIAYAPDGAVQLGGHGQAGAVLRLYLDAAPLSEVTVAPDGLWAVVLRDVAPGIYQMRVDQFGAEGKVTSRFETPFKRETLEALAAVAPAAKAPAVVTEPVAEVAPEPEAAAPAPVVVTEVPAAAPAPDAGSTAATLPAAVASAPATAPQAPVAAEPEPVPATAQASLTVTVQPGFTLWGIAEGRYGDGVMYVQVFDANKDKIKDPDLIYPGQVFTIPAAALPSN